jgi:hypothetical protein
VLCEIPASHSKSMAKLIYNAVLWLTCVLTGYVIVKCQIIFKDIPYSNYEVTHISYIRKATNVGMHFMSF